MNQDSLDRKRKELKLETEKAKKLLKKNLAEVKLTSYILPKGNLLKMANKFLKKF